MKPQFLESYKVRDIMVTCAVASCKNTSSKISKNKDGITFHRFPRDKTRRERWEIAVNREEDWSATSASTVCSEHFEATDFYLTESGLRRLSLEAVPSINISPVEAQSETVRVIEPIDIKPEDSEEVIHLKHKVRRLEVIAANRRRRLQLMWQAKRRMRMKLDSMTSLLKHMIQHKRHTEGKGR